MNCLAAVSPHLPQTLWACLHETFYLHEETAALPSPSWADPNLCVSDGGRKRGQGRGTEEMDVLRGAMVCPAVLPVLLCWLAFHSSVARKYLCWQMSQC